MLLYQDIKPHSLVTSQCDIRQRTRSAVITHFYNGKSSESQMCRWQYQALLFNFVVFQDYLSWKTIVHGVVLLLPVVQPEVLCASRKLT